MWISCWIILMISSWISQQTSQAGASKLLGHLGQKIIHFAQKTGTYRDRCDRDREKNTPPVLGTKMCVDNLSNVISYIFHYIFLYKYM